MIEIVVTNFTTHSTLNIPPIYFNYLCMINIQLLLIYLHPLLTVQYLNGRYSTNIKKDTTNRNVYNYYLNLNLLMN